MWHHCASLLLFLLVHTVLTLILALSLALALALLVQQVLTLFQRIDDAACDLLRRALARDAELLTNALELRSWLGEKPLLVDIQRLDWACALGRAARACRRHKVVTR